MVIEHRYIRERRRGENWQAAQVYNTGSTHRHSRREGFGEADGP